MKRLLNPFRSSYWYSPKVDFYSKTKIPMLFYAFYFSFKIFVITLQDSFVKPKITARLAPETVERLKRQTEELQSKIETSTTQ